MQPYRSIWFTILVVEVSTIVLTSAGVCKAPSHTAVLGKRAPDDKLLYRNRIRKDYQFLGFAGKFIKYPLEGQERKNITLIEIIDQYTDGNGGCFAIKKGGVGYDHVDLFLISQFMRGLDFIVKIYGEN
ncbi:probable salivary secreted peptide isoform X1 [Rhodnius prolixus]|uniref:probable salivary secreted peptide isoform X1 n=1 Tax=Rhodnius prolixus TaxID=13249 RepID=UPI003D18A757